jgi:cytochrome c
MKKLAGLILCGSMIWCSSLVASEQPSVAMGKKLFNSSKLGTSGKSCATCHDDVRKLKGAAAEDADELAENINQCIAGPLRGKKLAPDSTEMKAMLLYLKSLADTDK